MQFKKPKKDKIDKNSLTIDLEYLKRSEHYYDLEYRNSIIVR